MKLHVSGLLTHFMKAPTLMILSSALPQALIPMVTTLDLIITNQCKSPMVPSPWYLPHLSCKISFLPPEAPRFKKSRHYQLPSPCPHPLHALSSSLQCQLPLCSRSLIPSVPMPSLPTSLLFHYVCLANFQVSFSLCCSGLWTQYSWPWLRTCTRPCRLDLLETHSPNLQGACDATQQPYSIPHSPYRHPPTPLNDCFTPSSFFSHVQHFLPPFSLSADDLASYFPGKIGTIRRELPQTPTTSSTHLQPSVSEYSAFLWLLKMNFLLLSKVHV